MKRIISPLVLQNQPTIFTEETLEYHTILEIFPDYSQLEIQSALQRLKIGDKTFLLTYFPMNIEDKTELKEKYQCEPLLAQKICGIILYEVFLMLQKPNYKPIYFYTKTLSANHIYDIYPQENVNKALSLLTEEDRNLYLLYNPQQGEKKSPKEIAILLNCPKASVITNKLIKINDILLKYLENPILLKDENPLFQEFYMYRQVDVLATLSTLSDSKIVLFLLCYPIIGRKKTLEEVAQLKECTAATIRSQISCIYMTLMDKLGHFDIRQLQGDFNSYVDILTEEQRTIFLMAYFNSSNYDIGEIATLLCQKEEMIIEQLWNALLKIHEIKMQLQKEMLSTHKTYRKYKLPN